MTLLPKIGACGVFLTLGCAWLLEYFYFALPCTLCLFQRALYILLGIVFIIHVLYPKLPKLYLFIEFTLSGLGMCLAGKQIWLEWHPPQFSTCTQSITDLIEIYPLLEALRTALSKADCSEAPFFLFGLSLATWSLILFVGLLGLSVGHFWQYNKEKRT